MREIVFDTETTGLDPAQGHRLVEIGCLELVDRRETGRVFHAYFNPQRDMPVEAEAVHGLSNRFLSDKPLFTDQLDSLLDFLGDAPLIAHNAVFDFGFVNAELALADRAALDPERMICTLRMARRLHPGGKQTLDALCVRYGIDRSRRVKHGALLDAELLAQLYIEMTGGRQIDLGLAPLADGTDESATSRSSRPVALAIPGVPLVGGTALPCPPRLFEPSVAERARHAKFLETISAPIWLDDRDAVDESPSQS